MTTEAPPFEGIDLSRQRLREDVDMFGEVRTVWNVPNAQQFHGEEFLADSLLEELYDEVARDYYGDVGDTERWRLRFLWKKTGGTKLGKCTLASGLVRHYSGCDFVIWFAADLVKLHYFGERQMAALMFHELLHVDSKEDKDGIAQPSIRKHDAELFADEIRRFGAWHTDLERIGHAFAEVR